MMNQEQQTSQVAGQRIRVQSYLYLQCWHQIDFPIYVCMRGCIYIMYVRYVCVGYEQKIFCFFFVGGGTGFVLEKLNKNKKC